MSYKYEIHTTVLILQIWTVQLYRPLWVSINTQEVQEALRECHLCFLKQFLVKNSYPCVVIKKNLAMHRSVELRQLTPQN